jgi:hypothetical protein
MKKPANLIRQRSDDVAASAEGHIAKLRLHFRH